MPELPEIQILADSLTSSLLGATPTSCSWYRDGLREKFPKKDIEQYFCKSPIEKVSRRSKYLLLSTKHSTILLHLGMSGKLLYTKNPKTTPLVKHTHFEIFFGSKFSLRYIDPRRFGRLGFCFRGTEDDHEFLKNLGPEPLTTKNLASLLREKMKFSKAPVKNFIMNAKNIVGVGNIYAQESLFEAKILPSRKASTLDTHEISLLSSAIKRILSTSIKNGGTSFRDYVHADGKKGHNVSSLKVYGRASQPCLRCSSPLRQSIQSGRSSVFCSNCQK